MGKNYVPRCFGIADLLAEPRIWEEPAFVSIDLHHVLRDTGGLEKQIDSQIENARWRLPQFKRDGEGVGTAAVCLVARTRMEPAPGFLGITRADDELRIPARGKIPLVIEFESGIVDLADFPKDALRALSLQAKYPKRGEGDCANPFRSLD